MLYDLSINAKAYTNIWTAVSFLSCGLVVIFSAPLHALLLRRVTFLSICANKSKLLLWNVPPHKFKLFAIQSMHCSNGMEFQQIAIDFHILVDQMIFRFTKFVFVFFKQHYINILCIAICMKT